MAGANTGMKYGAGAGAISGGVLGGGVGAIKGLINHRHNLAEAKKFKRNLAIGAAGVAGVAGLGGVGMAIHNHRNKHGK
jgi:hypothetical protein